ncbi:MAG: SAM-dependent chlorinase/fluorinase [bacterium]|nr:SAM-dependent chlorinase/fluorinase [bacterium]
MHPRPSGIVTLLTDFGVKDPYVGIMKGALLQRSPKITIVDLCHAIPPQEVAVGAFGLAAAIGRFPDGTVHVGVVDPGVGTHRRMLAASVHGCYWIGPDNGLLGTVLGPTVANATPGSPGGPVAEVREIDCERLGTAPESRTFHGRDVFGPVAAWLAAGRYGFSALGPRVEDPVMPTDSGGVGDGRIVYVDGFGNLVTDVAGAAIEGARNVFVGGRVVPIHATYGEVAEGELLALVGSFGLLEIAQNCGNAARTLGVERGATIELRS